MATVDYHYWPFSIPATGHAEQVSFLETAHKAGHESFRFGTNDYGARAKDREGLIIERGRSRWEIRLAQGEQRSLLAFVTDFSSAGGAVRQWLDGSCAKEIVRSLSPYLVTPPGANGSYVITEDDCSPS